MAMSDRHKWQLMALIVGLSFLLWLLGPVLTPFVIAALLAYLGDPLVDWLERLRLSRSGAVAIVFVLMTLVLVGVVLLLIPLLERQISAFIEQFPRYRDWFTGIALPWISQRTGFDVEGIELGSIYSSFVGYSEYDSEVIRKFQGFDQMHCSRICRHYQPDVQA